MYIACKKHPLTDGQKRRKLVRAQNNLKNSVDGWFQVIWIEENYLIDGPVIKIFIAGKFRFHLIYGQVQPKIQYSKQNEELSSI